MKILVVRFSSIGDIVLTTPVVRCLKTQLHAEVHYVSKTSFQSFLATNPYIDQGYYFSKNIEEVLPQLKLEGYDFIVDLHNNLRSLRLKKALKIPSSAFPKLNIQKWLLVNFKLPIMPNIHIVERYFKAVESLGVVPDEKGLDYFVPKKDEVDLSDFPNAFCNQGYIAFVIGGQHAGKMMNAKKITKICSAIDFPILLLGGPDDAEKGSEIAAACKGHVINAAGKYSLNQSASLIKQSKLVVTHDTGLMHIASAFQKDIISLWGGTVPELGMYPYKPGSNSLILQEPHFMRPPSKLGKHRGIYKLWDFMEMIPDEKIIAAIQDRIKPVAHAHL